MAPLLSDRGGRGGEGERGRGESRGSMKKGWELLFMVVKLVIC
jgi:hypothetical protein